MRKRFKRLMLIIFTGIISIFVLILSVSFINHKIQLSKEEELFAPTGQLVEVNGRQMHVYTEGNGEETLVFMSGGGTSSPVLDFVVIEKAGYGFSEVTDTDRDIDTILSETREVLLKSGVEGPYILFPHSMSGIEALNWAQVYPDEIKAIIGLDMAVPAAYENFDINMSLVRLGAFAANTGLTRWITNLSESDAIKYGTLTDEEQELYKAIFYRRTSTKNMINEIKNIKANAQKVKEAGTPNAPILLFSSNGQETGFDEKKWIEIQNNFNNKNDNASLIELNSSHYIHNIDYRQIAKESEEFIESLNR
ncbi:alpha/beta fold hydrolase [Lentibacillus sp. CBA3610]|uniref:alpha/beta fold hydrolase n=1 Tax=Lentibacillus sp. CBA3610 TaxID=2518176 RepID=UPI0020D21777|nr:alpha/beta hydrolase [Lentibacillus sp. CBA3610]